MQLPDANREQTRLASTRAIEGKALILLATFFPQCVVSMLSMTPPVMASQIAYSLGLSPHLAGVYVGLVYGGAILSSSFAASLITRMGPLRTSFACVVTGGAGLALFAVPHLAASLFATAIIGLSYGPLRESDRRPETSSEPVAWMRRRSSSSQARRGRGYGK